MIRRYCRECGCALVRMPADPAALVCVACPALDADELQEAHHFHGVPRGNAERIVAEWDSREYLKGNY